MDSIGLYIMRAICEAMIACSSGLELGEEGTGWRGTDGAHQVARYLNLRAICMGSVQYVRPTTGMYRAICDPS